MFAAFFVEFWLTESKNHLGPFRFKSTFSLLASKKSIIVFFLIKSPVRTGAIESVMPQDARSSSVSQVSRCRYLIVQARENSELEVIWSPLSRERDVTRCENARPGNGYEISPSPLLRLVLT